LQTEFDSAVKPFFLCSVLVANAGEAFAEQLDVSHKNSCPWRGSSCADSLIQLHLTQSALIGGFKDRCDGLLQFLSLPVIASSAIENMRLTRDAQINRLLTQAITFLSGELGYKAESTPGVDIHQGSSCGYSRVCFYVSCISVRYFYLWHYYSNNTSIL
jgi:hypothetical protein